VAPLRLAIIRSKYSAFGGAEQFISRMAQALAQREIQVTLITREWRPEPGLKAIVCDPLYLGSLWRDWGFARAACRAAGNGAFDLVQSHERLPCCDLYRAGDGVHREWLQQRNRTLGALARLRIDLNPFHRYLLAAEKRLFASPRLKAVICNSAMVKAEIQRWFGLSEQKLHVIYSGVDTERYSPSVREQFRAIARAQHGIPLEATLFLFIGSGFERKGLAQAIRALATLAQPAYLLVVGKDKQAARFEALARRLGVAARVRFAGAVSDPQPCYGAADALLLPTLYDPFPNVMLEAMACGLPVITSTKSGGAELIKNGENGWVCDALDLPALSAAMTELLSATARERLGRAARATVAPLTLERMSQEYLALYRALLGESGRL
jgi:UDP-glucose:(heptosyl)LPS alpha-1,3-glucosyltransferase